MAQERSKVSLTSRLLSEDKEISPALNIPQKISHAVGFDTNIKSGPKIFSFADSHKYIFFKSATSVSKN